jgi:hypothetical protein
VGHRCRNDSEPIKSIPIGVSADKPLSCNKILIDEGSAEGFRIIADARQYLLDLGRQTPVAAEGLNRDEIDRLILREKRRVKKARRKAKAFEGVGGTLEMIDGQEVLRIGDQLYYPETMDETESSPTTMQEEEIEDTDDEPPIPRPATSDRFVGSHVIAPVRPFCSLLLHGGIW